MVISFKVLQIEKKLFNIAFNDVSIHFQGRTGQRGHNGMPGLPVSVHIQRLRVMEILNSPLC